MPGVLIMMLRGVLTLALVMSVLVEAVVAPAMYRDLRGAESDLAAVRVPLVLIVVLGVLMAQVCAVSVWRLLTMAHRGTVFTRAALRWVDTIIGAIALAAVLCFALGTVLAPGEAAAPGVVALLGLLGVLVVGVALIVWVQRTLLAQAVVRDAEARALEHELDGVV
jgi:xanthosine utilization system XapX-like protein